MEKMILVDIETGDFDVESGINEVALLVVEKGKIVAAEHLAEVEDEEIIGGMGAGYADISADDTYKTQFQRIIEQYPYPIVAHNVSFDRKFLVHYGWIPEDYECYDSIRVIKYANPFLFLYKLDYLSLFYQVDTLLSHKAIDDVHVLYEVLLKAKPTVWMPLYRASPKKFRRIVEESASIEGESTIFQDKRMVFTGSSQFPRVMMKEMAKNCGAIVTGSVSTKTDILICGEKAGSKLIKARELGIEVQTDEWFIDTISNELNLETASISRKTVGIIRKEEPKVTYKKLPELVGKKVNIALLPMRIQSQVEDILLNYMEVSGISKSTTSYKVDVIIHGEGRDDYVLLEKAKELNIPTIPLSTFNRKILN